MSNSLDIYLNRFLKKRFNALDAAKGSDNVTFDKRFFNYINANQDKDKATKIIDYISLYLMRRDAVSANIEVREKDYSVNYARRCV